MAAEIYLQHGYIKDILGYIYTTGQYYKKAMGQYFTPDNIAIFMTEIINGDFKQLEKEEFISVSEPTCGSGVMVLAFAQNMLKRNQLSEFYVRRCMGFRPNLRPYGLCTIFYL